MTRAGRSQIRAGSRRRPANSGALRLTQAAPTGARPGVDVVTWATQGPSTRRAARRFPEARTLPATAARGTSYCRAGTG